MRLSTQLLFAILTLGAVAFGAPAGAQQGQKASKKQGKGDAAGKEATWAEQAQEFYQRGEWVEAQKAWQRAYDSAAEDSPARAEAALNLSSLLWEQGDFGRAKRQMDDALRLARSLKLDGEVGRLLLIKGQIEVSRGEMSAAESTFGICMKSAADQGDELFSALCAINRRMVRQLRGRPAGPESDYRRAIETVKNGDAPLAVASGLVKTADIYEKAGHFDQALELLEAAQREYDAAASVPAQLRNKLRLARVLQRMGRYDEARAHLSGQVAQFQAMNNRPALVDALILSADDAQHRGQSTEAGRLYAQALNIAKKTQSPSLIARGHLALCQFGQRGGADSVESTIAHCKDAADAFKKLDAPTLVAQSRAEMAGIYHGKGRLNEASAHYSGAIQILEHAGLPGADYSAEVARFRANLCQVEMSLQARGAFYICRKALGELDKLEPSPQDMIAHTEYAAGISAGRDWQAAKGLLHLENAARIARELSPPNLRLAAEAYLHRGVLLSEMSGRKDDAIQSFKDGIELVELNEGSDPMLAAAGVQLRTQLAQFQLNQSDWRAARESLSALIVNKRAPADARAWAYSGLANAELKLGDKKAAREALKEGLPLAREAGDNELIKTFEENLETLK